MGQTLVEKILSNNMGHPVHAGETVVVNVDFAALHDGSGPLLVRLMEERGYDKEPVFDKDKMLFANEFGPESTREISCEHALCKQYAQEHGCAWEEPGTGHVHAHVYEQYLKCGSVCIIGDSHTTVHGAFGCFATGCGSTDMVAVTRFGKTWIKVPETFRINVNGKLPEWVGAKDIMLKLAGIIKSDQAIYKSLEFRGSTIADLSMEGRITITSMGVDVGAKCAIMETDEHTRAFLKSFGREEDYKEIRGDEDADYERVIDIDAAKLEPMVSKPHYTKDLQTSITGTGVELAGARQHIIIAARAAGKQCFDTVYTNLDDMEGFARDVQMIRDMGFDGKSIVNPRQIETVHRIFTPTPKQILFAEKVVREIDEKRAQGIGVFTVDGKMIDIAFYDGARRTLAMAEAAGVYEGELEHD